MVQNQTPHTTDAVIRERDEFEATHTGFIHERMNALADGVTAIAMTILVLEIRVPEGTSVAELSALATQIGLFALSFVVVANFYYSRMRFMSLVSKSTTILTLADFLFLLGICLIPLFTKMMFEYPDHRLSVAGYGAVILLVTYILNVIGSIILRYHLVSSQFMDETYTHPDSLRILRRESNSNIWSTVFVTVLAILLPSFGVWFYVISPVASFLRRYRVGKVYTQLGRVPTIFDEMLERSLFRRRRRR